MTIHPGMSTSKEAFLDWVAHQEGKYEYAGGRVTMMVEVTRNHARVVSNILAALTRRLDPERYDVLPEAFGVDLDRSYRFPDVVVQPFMSEGHARRSEEPLVLFEVLSPSTMRTDFGDKADEYRALPSLTAYVVASADEPQVWVWQRKADGAFDKDPEPIAGRDRELPLPGLGVSVPLAELYAGIGA